MASVMTCSVPARARLTARPTWSKSAVPIVISQVVSTPRSFMIGTSRFSTSTPAPP